MSGIAARRHLLLFALLLVHALLLSACGWHLRGSFNFPASMERLYIEGTAQYSELGVAIHNAFQGSNISVVSHAGQARAILHILSDKSEQRILATDSSGRATEYEVSYTLGFRMEDEKGGLMLPAQQVKSKREYRFDASNVLASGGEVERLKKDMINNSVQQMLRRINAGLKSQLR